MTISNLLLAALFLSLTLSAVHAQTTQPSTKLKIALVGDSTVTEESGWGLGFKKAAGDSVEVTNFAKGGRSSKSYRDEKHWDKAVASKGDYMLIQFGHNDQPGKGADRETDAKTTFRENMARYVKEAQAAGFKVVLVTSMTRRRFKEDGKIKSDLVDYVEGTRAVAEELKVPLIDLHEITLKFFDDLGAEKTHEYEPKNKDNDGYDSTHLNAKGGEAIGKLMFEAFTKAVPDAIR